MTIEDMKKTLWTAANQLRGSVSAAVYDDVIGNVTLMDQYALLEVLQKRKKHLTEQVKLLL